MSYAEFLDAKVHHRGADGFEPEWMPPFLFDFQASLTEWAIRHGRAAIFADCGLGKTPMQLVNLQMLDHGYEQETWLTQVDEAVTA